MSQNMTELWKFTKMPRLWRNSFLYHNFDILSVTLWVIENKPSQGFALAVLLMNSWDNFWLLTVVANRTTWLNNKVTAYGHFQSPPKLARDDRINIHQASTARLDNNTANYYQSWLKVSNIRSRRVQQTSLDLSIMQFN